MRLTFSFRPGTCFFFGLLLLNGCRRRPPPPPTAITLPLPTVAPIPTAPPEEPASTWRYVQVVGLTDTSILISVDGTLPVGAPKSKVALPPGFTPHATYMVVTLAEGCVTRTEVFPMVDEAFWRSATFDNANDVPQGPSRVLPIANNPIFHEQFVRKQALFAEFDANGDRQSAWSADGKRALLAADDQMYRSDDGITFSVIDVNASYAPKMTRDGRVGIYRRCSHPCGGGYRLAQIALGHSSSPRFVVGPDMHDFAFDFGETSVVYARETKAGNELCIERLDLLTGRVIRLACEPTSMVISENVLSMSGDASFGALETYGSPPEKAAHLVVYDLRAGARQRMIDALGNDPPVDDQGRVALEDIGTGGARVSDADAIQVVGRGEPLAWDHAHRLVVLNRAALNDPQRCSVVSTIPVTP